MSGLLVVALIAALIAAGVPLMGRLGLSTEAIIPRLATVPPDDRAARSSSAQGERIVQQAITGPPPSPANAAEDDAAGVRAVGYVSVHDHRGRAELALREQIAAIDELCERRRWRLIEVARDLPHALERLAGSDASCLIVAELRRLGSPVELGDTLTWLRERELRFLAVDVDLDTGAPEGGIAVDALIAVGELERARQGRDAAGKPAGSGARGEPPRRPAVHDVPALRQHIVAMRSSGMTLQAIADRLNDEGIPTLRGGQKWRPSSVQAAAGYRRPGQLSQPRRYDRRVYQRRVGDR